MNPVRAELRLKNNRLHFFCKPAALDEKAELTDADRCLFAPWIEAYRKGVESEPACLKVGQALWNWLLQKFGSPLGEVLDATPPLILEVIVPPKPGALAATFLELPWELLANKAGFLAAQNCRLAPLRRLGPAAEPQAPSTHRLSMLFMAAAPQGAIELDYEAEEAAILSAVDAHTGLDLIIEESGTLREFAARAGEEKPVDIYHLSCHGNNAPEPVLMLENEFGGPAPVSAGMLADELGEPPRLLVISACCSADPAEDANQLINSFATAMIGKGYPAVLGWGGSVVDHEATEFAAHLVRGLAKKQPLAFALAGARQALLQPENASPTRQRPDAWHTARLYLAPTGGGPLTAGNLAKRLTGRQHGVRAFLDEKGRDVPVANRFEFVGRRRQMQHLLRTLRAEKEFAGAMIRGVGQQGKSSLAARVANRLPDHTTVVIFKHYDEEAILSKIYTVTGEAAVKACLDAVRQDRSAFAGALQRLLAGPFAQAGAKKTQRPILLVIDDLEQILDDPVAESLPHEVNKDAARAIAGVIQAFQYAATCSRLLFTSRFRFRVQCDGQNMADKLFDCPLPPMDETGLKKQLLARGRLEARLPAAHVFNLLLHALDTAKGNPGLLNRLYLLLKGMDNETAARAALQKIAGDMDAYMAGRKTPDEQELIDFVERLALTAVLDLLSEPQHALLRALQVFNLPAPAEVVRALAEATAAAADLDRVQGLGLVESFPDLVQPQKTALALNAFARGQLQPLTATEREALAQQALPGLRQQWPFDNLPGLAATEVLHLALPAQEGEAILAAGEKALSFWNGLSQYREGSRQAIGCARIVRSAGLQPGWRFWQLAGQLCAGAVMMQEADACLESAFAAVSGAEEGTFEFASLLLDRGRRQQQKGALAEALDSLEQAGEIFEKLGAERSRAVTLGDIANILKNKGDVDGALALHEERRVVFEKLGDQRSRAVTLGDIARIKVSKGDVDGALALHEEMIDVFEKLGDQDGIANACWSLAQIQLQRQEVQPAFENLLKSYQINQQLGRLDGICFVGMDLGPLLIRDGQKEEGLAMLERSQAGFLQLQQPHLAEQVAQIIAQMAADT